MKITIYGWSTSQYELYGCFTARADALFELGDAVLRVDAPVKTLAGLSLAPEQPARAWRFRGRGTPPRLAVGRRKL